MQPPIASGQVSIVAVQMTADGSRYQGCAAGHAAAVGAFDLLSAAYDKLLNALSNGGKK